MKKVLSLVLISLIVIFAGIKIGGIFRDKRNDNTQIKNTAVSVTPFLSEPSRIVIPKINVDANIESVGLDNKNAMDVPKKVEDTAWYNLGKKPGEVGNAVIDGHYDTQTGAPAVFYYLSKLSKGDEIIIYAKDGSKKIFKVTEGKFYPYNTFPIQYVFGPTNRKRLELITCGGVWDKTSRNYSERFVVSSEME